MEEKMAMVSLSAMVLGFFEEGERKEGKEWGRDPMDRHGGCSDEEDGSDGSESSALESKAFWETQHQLLQEALSKNSSVEAKIRMATEDAVKKMQSAGFVCICPNRMAEGCRNCARRHIAERLREAGFNSALCKSKWRRSPNIPSGEHSYVDVVMEAKNGKRSPIRVVIELNFRAEFEMARASQEYSNLVNCLPEVFVGKSEKLKSVIKIMCSAAKKCMKDNKMHMGPWRKHKYMQSKWLGTPERISPWPLLPTPASDRQPKLRASMLTFDLHCTAVEVV
ncbi:uncharacterized protein LOC103721275 [Phoenix dactylifera]|uniref:Uncharacterized protein LOC103721275 n=1 Tax=Phoenix dactylifera TaxID=42345 RepID=A0A8B7CZ96_PHODC|nr:uncharacterized protein LOC103721275 [Phoenix dactylifera]